MYFCQRQVEERVDVVDLGEGLPAKSPNHAFIAWCSPVVCVRFVPLALCTSCGAWVCVEWQLTSNARESTLRNENKLSVWTPLGAVRCRRRRPGHRCCRSRAPQPHRGETGETVDVGQDAVGSSFTLSGRSPWLAPPLRTGALPSTPTPTSHQPQHQPSALLWGPL